MRTAQPPVLSATEIAKTFGATRALRSATIALYPGEVHALLGENGAGKSTLIKILAGASSPDAGVLRLRGIEIRLASVRDAVRLGIVPIYQHLSLMPHLSILENLLAFEWASGPMWRGRPRTGSTERARAMLTRMGVEADLRTAVGALSLAARQIIEIARGVSRDCSVLILDEPTAALNRIEAQHLLSVIRMLCAEGKAILLISHNLNEVAEIAHRITILRDGISVTEGVPCGQISRHDIIERMIGHRLDSAGRHELPQPGDPVLRVQELSVAGALDKASFELRRGEILGVVGLIGSGAVELGQAVAGTIQRATGRILCEGRRIPPGNRVAALAAGIGLVPAERESDGTFPGRPVLENASAGSLDELGRGGWLGPRREYDRFRPWLRRLRVLPNDTVAPIDSLSGGNQQKVLLARNLARDRLSILVAINPTRSVDIGTRAIIHQALVDAAHRGVAILVVSSGIEEISVICHRVLVVCDGRLAADLPGDSDPAAILAPLTGAAG